MMQLSRWAIKLPLAFTLPLCPNPMREKNNSNKNIYWEMSCLDQFILRETQETFPLVHFRFASIWLHQFVFDQSFMESNFLCLFYSHIIVFLNFIYITSHCNYFSQDTRVRAFLVWLDMYLLNCAVYILYICILHFLIMQLQLPLMSWDTHTHTHTHTHTQTHTHTHRHSASRLLEMAPDQCQRGGKRTR